MKIEIWSDFACPYCYLGDRRLEQALATFDHKDEVEVSYRSFQLDVHATSHAEEDIAQLVAKKYGISYEQAKAANNRISIAGKKLGLNYNFDAVKANNTGIAHQILHFAKEKGLEKEVVARLFKAYFEEGIDLGLVENLIVLAKEIGFIEDEVKEALSNKRYESAVAMDQNHALDLGITGVPYFIFNDKYAVSGAQDLEYFKAVLAEVYEEEKRD